MQQCAYTESVLIIAGGKLQPLHQGCREHILLSTAGRATLHPSQYGGRGGVGRASEARLEFLSFDGMGEVCRHVTKHTVCMIGYPGGKSRAQPY